MCDCPYCTCDAPWHERVKMDDVLWHERTVELGIQDDGAGGRLELRNCRDCGSTLARQAPPSETTRDRALTVIAMRVADCAPPLVRAAWGPGFGGDVMAYDAAHALAPLVLDDPIACVLLSTSDVADLVCDMLATMAKED